MRSPCLGLTITGGSAGNGGGFLVQDDALTLTDCAIVGNKATVDDGGGIHVAAGGSLTVRGSTLSGNSADCGGAIDFYSGGGTLQLENSTVSGNSATNVGGGIYFRGTAGTGITIRNSTITANTASIGGGGIFRAPVARPPSPSPAASSAATSAAARPTFTALRR